MNSLFDSLWGKRIRIATDRHLRAVASGSINASRQHATQLIDRLAQTSEPLILVGQTLWGAPIRVPLNEFIRAYSLVTGGTGSGKTHYALALIEAILVRFPTDRGAFGILDPKGDLFHGTLYLLAQRLAELAKSDPNAARDLRRRIVIIDFGSADPVTAYNLLARWPEAEADFFASSRAEILLDLLSGSDKLSLGGTAVLTKLLLLLSEFELPITYIDEVLTDTGLLERLVSQSQNEVVRAYFVRQFPSVPKPTIAALRRRIEALFASSSVRLALAGKTAPDFRKLQDEGMIVLVNCFGSTISRGVRHVLQGLVLSDIRQAVFARRQRDIPFLWIADEAHQFFLTEKLRDNMSELLTMSRAFNTFFLFITQNMTTAVQDARVLKVLYTNIRWSFSMRGDPGDCAFLKSALPVTGRRLRPRTDPFAERTFCSPSEERGLLLDEVANLPDRVGYFWLKTETAEAIPMRTPDLAIPPGPDLEAAVLSLKRDASFGSRTSRKVYNRVIAERELKWLDSVQPNGNGNEALAQAYRRKRGES